FYLFNLIDQKHVFDLEDKNIDINSGIEKQSIPVNLTVTTKYKRNTDEYNRLQELYKKYQNDREVNIINTYREVLKNKVKIKTIPIQKDSVKIKKH
ncbi:MAG TPA: hypothetical protein PKJ42_05070, partial [Candidatus Goldiibacteriota bacterium]|nr:hypothetical protein [Candidatus Goldiibacteriota bacterium]